ncbi:MAG TPA: biosynthetic-type acetolactate synthase large subunit [Chloroflexota bacterium]
MVVETVETTRKGSSSERSERQLLTGAQILWQSLLDEGVRTVFGYPGGAVLPLYHALSGFPELNHVLVRHEENAALAADGFARATGEVGVCVATSGPGATNLVTGIANAYMDSVPMVAFTGQVATTSVGRMAFQEVDITNICKPITKRSYFVRHVDELAAVVREAFHVAADGRPGPVVVDLPKDVQNGKAYYERPSNGLVHRLPKPPADGDREVQRAAKLLMEAKRPVLLVGHGVLQSGAARELLALAETTETPVVTTLLGISAIPETHRLCFGMIGMHGHFWSNQAVQQADLVIAVGMRFDDRVAVKPSEFAPGAKIVHIDIDLNEMGRNVRVDVPIVGDARVVLQMLLERVQRTRHFEWVQQLEVWREESPTANGWHEYERPQVSEVIKAIRTATGGNALVASDVGQHLMWVAQHFCFDKPGSFFCSGGLGSMGYGVPAAIGAKAGRPEETVWAVVGDGGFQMSSPELATLAQHNIGVKIALLNNGYLGMVRQWQQFFFESNYSQSPIPGPDFVALATAHGVPACRVTEPSEVAAAVERAMAHDGPFLIEFAVEPEENVFPMVAPGTSLNEMIMEC